METRTSELEENRIKLEHSLELKDSLTTTLIETAEKTKSLDTLSATSIPFFTTSSTSLIQYTRGVPETMVHKKENECQTDPVLQINQEVATTDESQRTPDINETKTETNHENEYGGMIQCLKSKIADLEANLTSKNRIIEEFELIKQQQSHISDSQQSFRSEYVPPVDELKDALQVHFKSRFQILSSFDKRASRSIQTKLMIWKL